MCSQLRTATAMLLALSLLTGGIYPLVVTLIAQTVFHQRASGSLLKQGDRLIGSELVGQSFSKPEYFWGRLSATSPVPFNAAASSGSNYGPLHPDLKAAAEKRIAALTADGSQSENIPIDLVTASGSGLDPHISIAAAEYQVPRIAKTRGLTEDQVSNLVVQHTHHRQLGVLGEPRVHVLNLNLALDHVESGK